MRLADISTELLDGVLVARLEGELDMSNAAELGSVITGRMTNDALGLVLDFTKVSYMDSTGVNVLFQLRESLARRGQELRLVLPADSPIGKVISIVGLPEVIGVTATLDEALGGIAAKLGASGPSEKTSADD
jgi:anti-sigma B factor antagonist